MKKIRIAGWVIVVVLSALIPIASFAVSKSPPKDASIELTIRTPEKTSYKAGDAFEGGEYALSYSGQPFEGLVMYSVSAHTIGRYGEENSFLQGVIKEGNSAAFNRRFKAFSVGGDKTEMFLDSFPEEGTYSFQMAVYSCEDVKSAAKKKCSDPSLTRDDLRKGARPLKSAMKTVFVTPKPNCKSDRDCKKPCENCAGGVLHCSEKSKTCVQCDLQVNCKKGSSCQHIEENFNYECVGGFKKVFMPAQAKKEKVIRNSVEVIK